jgi:multiple sugar transport system permease protein
MGGRNGAKAGRAVNYILLSAGLVVFLFPFWFMISNSFEKFSFTLPMPPHVFPVNFVWDNYASFLQNSQLYSGLLNSFLITAVTTVAVILVASLSAYGFARLRFPAKEAIYKLYLVTLMMPMVLALVPQFLTLNFLGVNATRQGLILLYVGTGICGATFFLRGFFEAVPKELDESVLMDGGGHFTIFSRIVLPLSSPAIATFAVLSAQGTWDDFFTAKVILGAKTEMQTMPIVIQRLHGQFSTQWGLIFAASLLMLLPVFVLYIFVQKKFVVGGITAGAVKG